MPITLGEEALALKQCQNCFRSDSKAAPLLCCALCKRSHYCNKECQKADWKGHKLVCKIKREMRDDMNRYREISFVGGVSYLEAENTTKKWVQCFTPILNAAVIQALQLRSFPDRNLTHVLAIAISPTFTTNAPKTDDAIRRAFKLEKVNVMSKEEATDLLQSITHHEASDSSEAIKYAFGFHAGKTDSIKKEHPDWIGVATVLVMVPMFSIHRFVPFIYQGVDTLQKHPLVSDSVWIETMRRCFDDGTVL